MKINDMIAKIHEEEFLNETSRPKVEGKRPQDNDSSSEKIKQMDPEKLVKKLNETADNNEKGIKFEKVEELNDWIVKVIDKNSGEIIRQIPSEEVIQISKGINEMLGNIYDKKG